LPIRNNSDIASQSVFDQSGGLTNIPIFLRECC
jgi:hypothetical protein